MGIKLPMPDERPSDAHVQEKDLRPGYPKLAGHMGLCPEVAIFRRFGALNMTNLLYMQDELLELEQSFRGRERIDDEENRGYSVDWCKLRESEGEDGEEGSQFRMLQNVRSKLKEYSEYYILLN